MQINEHEHGRRLLQGVDAVEKYAGRFLGVRIDYRFAGTTWPKPWRLKRLATKNERSEYRVTEYFDSFTELVEWMAETERETNDS